MWRVQIRSRSPVASIVAISSVLALFGALFFWFPYSFGYGDRRVSLAEMVYGLWSEYGDWEHGMLVLPIVAFLVWRKRRELAELKVQGSYWGLGMVLFSFLLYWAGFRADVQYVGFISAQLLVAGLVLWLLGKAHMRILFFPWLFLGFMWPFVFLDTQIAFPLRMIMAEVSHRFLNLIGLETLRVGSAIVSAPDVAAGLAQGERFEVDIADPCSGIRSLFALTMVAALYGYLTLKKGWQVAFLIVAAFPLAILGNFVRIMMLTFGVLAFGADFSIGTIDHPSGYHMFSGFAVFAVALLGMLGVAKLLRAIPVWWEGRSPEVTQAAKPIQSAKKDETSFEY